jgi:phage gpG-like protein
MSRGLVMEFQATGDLRRFIDRVERVRRLNFTAMHQELGHFLRNRALDHFKEQSGADGAPWPKRHPASTSRKKLLSRSGRLRNSIHVRATPDQVEVGTDLEYAAIHQFGGQTRAHDIVARRAKALRFRGAGSKTATYRKAVHHPGSKIPAKRPA